MGRVVCCVFFFGGCKWGWCGFFHVGGLVSYIKGFEKGGGVDLVKWTFFDSTEIWTVGAERRNSSEMEKREYGLQEYVCRGSISSDLRTRNAVT